MWTAGLREWFVANGRHDLPWRLTTDPWAVLVSEVMLQQTSVARVLPRWEHFMARWPTARACAAVPLAEVLREWQGLGYPRRARALWLLAAAVTERGWPGEEAGLRALPGVGTYTARALLAFTELATAATAPPRDVNLGRVAARAALGREPHQVPPATLDGVLREGRPPAMPMREYAYALFDVGALHCRARPLCGGCPLAAACAWREHGGAPVERQPRRQPAYAGSLRQVRGAVLAHMLRCPGASRQEVAAAVAHMEGDAERVGRALDGLIADGLVADHTRSPH